MIRPLQIIGETPEVIKAINALNGVVSGSAFKEEFLKLEFDKTKGLSNQEIYELIIKDFPVNIKLTYKEYSDAGGTWIEEENLITVNSYHRRNFIQIAGTIAHEAAHGKGFADDSPIVRRAITYQFDELVRKLLMKHGYKEGKRLIRFRPWYFLWILKTTKWV